MNIGDLWVGIKADVNGDLKAAVTKAAGEAGDAGAKTLGERLKAGLGGAALKGAVLGISGALALATKGALEAEKAQGAFMSATGATREEAKQFVSEMNNLAGSAGAIGLSFEEIAATGTMVEQQFGTTGKATQDLTGYILEFAKVTGQDATQAASDLEDTLSTFGQDASGAAALMDQLKASSQEFGTDAGPAALQALRDMSPALQTMGGDLDDGIGFLNLFETAGLDAGTAATGLTKAVKGLKPGQTLDDLIAQIGSIEDPTLRAQEAIKLFGSRAGPKLAAAIQPGMTSLDDFKVSAEEASGSVHQAADDMLTFSDRIKGFVEKGLAGLREVGQQFGPVVTALGSMGTLFGPAIAKSLAAGWALAGKSPAVQAAIDAASGAMSGRLGTALKALGLVAVAAALTEIWIQATADTKDKIANNPNAITPTDLFNARAPMWAQAKVQIAQEMQTLGTEALAAFNKTWNEGIAKGLSPSDPALLAAAKAAGEAAGNTGGTATVETWGDALSSSGSWDDVVEGAASSFEGSVERNRNSLSLWALVREQQEKDAAEAKAAYEKSALAVTGSLADTLRQGAHSKIEDAMADLTYVIKHPMERLKQIAEIEGALASDKLKTSLASNNPDIKAQAEQTQSYLIGLWEELAGSPWPGRAADNLENHLNDGYPGAIADARGFVKTINDIFRSLTGKVGIKIDADLNAHGFGVPGRAAGGPVLAGHLYRVSEMGANTEYFRPDVNGTVLPLGDKSAAGVTIQGDLVINAPTGNAFDIRDAFNDLIQSARDGSRIRFRTA